MMLYLPCKSFLRKQRQKARSQSRNINFHELYYPMIKQLLIDLDEELFQVPRIQSIRSPKSTILKLKRTHAMNHVLVFIINLKQRIQIQTQILKLS